MATRYWVRGASTTAWNATSPKTNWGTASNTQDNASVPTSSDDVIFDGVGSGASDCSITLLYYAEVKTINFTGYSNSLSSSGILRVYGNATLSSGMTFSSNIKFYAASGTCYLASNGCVIDGSVRKEDNATLALSDNLSVNDELDINDGSFSTQNFNVTAYRFRASYMAGTISLGSSTITLTGTTSSSSYVWDFDSGATLSAGTSTIYLSTGTYRYFYGGGKTYYNLKFGAASRSVRIYNSNTFNNIEQEVDSTSSPIVYIQAGTTQTISSLTMTGYSSSKIISLGSLTASAHTISCPSGTISVNHIQIQYSTATGGASFVGGSDAIDLGNNTGWVLPDIYSYSGAVTVGVTPGSSYADFDGFTYSGSIPLSILPASTAHKNTEWNGSVTIGVTPSSSIVASLSWAGSQTIGFSPSHALVVELARAGSLPIAFTVSSTAYRLAAGYYPWTGRQTITVGVNSTIIIRKKLKVKDPVVTAGCPNCGCLTYNR